MKLCDLCESIQSKINSTIYNYDLEITSILEKNSKEYIKEKGMSIIFENVSKIFKH